MTDSFVESVIDTYKKVSGTAISQQDARCIIKVLSAHRDLGLEFSQYPDNVMRDICREKSLSAKVYYPCDVIELRDILETSTISDIGGVGFFDYLFCKKYFVDRPLVISFSCPKNEFRAVGSIGISSQNPFYIKHGVDCVYVREDQLSAEDIDSVYDIVKECSPGSAFHRLGDVPGMREPKVANTKRVLGLDDMATNWYSMMKQSDASSSEDPGSSYYEGRNPGEAPVEITFGPKSPLFPFTKGDKVRLRYPGWGFEHEIGRVVDQKYNVIIIEWETGKHKGKQLTLDMNDPVKLFSTIEKI